MSAEVLAINPQADAERAWQNYRAVLIRHSADLARWDDPDRVQERVVAYRQFEQSFESMP